jgi:hypothetical protein
VRLPKLSPEFVELCKRVTAKRPRTVIDHILKHGHVTSQELSDLCGHNHPPRAVRDVREHGIPIETFRVRGSDGRGIAAYRFGEPGMAGYRKGRGRTSLARRLKAQLLERSGPRCAIYLEAFDEASLQVDHRVPFEISGDEPSGHPDPSDFMLLSPSANRAKSWSCEHCPNWRGARSAAVCEERYWAFPEAYTHVATKPLRRLDIVWRGDEVEAFDRLCELAEESNENVPAYVKAVIARLTERGG